MNVGMYTGSFDPITRGHMDIIEQAKQVFDIVDIAILDNPAKADKYMFTLDERIKMVNDIYKNDPRVCVIVPTNAHMTAAQLAESMHINAFIRGLRNTIDFEYEKQMGYINKRATNYIPTVCFFSSPIYQFVSSSVVRELMQYNPTKEQMNDYVYRTVWEQIEEKLKSNK